LFVDSGKEMHLRKIVIESTGGPQQLVVTEVPTPQPGSGELLVQLEAAGVNYVDIHQRRGEFQVPKPFTPGQEGVGVVRAVGRDVKTYRVGDRVAWINVPGSYAEEVLVPESQGIAIPQHLSVEQALLLQPTTAEYLVHEYRTISPGDTALVHAAAGGVGQLLVQWLKHLGARVIATASASAKLDTLRRLGADVVIDYTRDRFVEAVLVASNGRGVDVAYDAVGKDTLLDSLECLATKGTVVSYGAASGPPPLIDLQALMGKSARVATGALFVYIADPHELQRRGRIALAALQEGWLRVQRAERYALTHAAEAHEAIESRRTQGKLYLFP
jgi:NADPH:quinone reductase